MQTDTLVARNQSAGAPSLLGASEPSSPWNFGAITGALGNLVGAGAQAYAAVKSFTDKPGAVVAAQSPVSKPATVAAAPVTSSSSASWRTWLPWALAGVGALVLVFFVARKS